MWNGVFIYVYTLLSITEIWNGMHVYIFVCTQEMLTGMPLFIILYSIEMCNGISYVQKCQYYCIMHVDGVHVYILFLYY